MANLYAKSRFSKPVVLLTLSFVDCGTSGGLAGARHGACFMAGGDPEAFKMVHNAIEFGMLQAIGEGTALLKQGPFKDLDLAAIFTNWIVEEALRSEVGLNPDNFNLGHGAFCIAG